MPHFWVLRFSRERKSSGTPYATAAAPVRKRNRHAVRALATASSSDPPEVQCSRSAVHSRLIYTDETRREPGSRYRTKARNGDRVEISIARLAVSDVPEIGD